ncbi:MAG: hypothetical protein IPM29_26290 [Planctomycetes bacterium]|nr:hypothetical protein [Planctomycetota bacterium]
MIHRTLPSLTLGAAVLASGLSAQAVRALPRSATDAFAGSTNFSIPTVSFRAQYWFDATNLPTTTTITALGIRVQRGAATLAATRPVEITVADTTLPFASYSPLFDQNLGAAPTTFLAPRNINFAANPPATDPNVAGAWFPGDRPLLFTGPNLVVDFRVGTSSGGASVPNDGLVMGTGAAATLHLQGRPSCGGTLAGAWAGNQWTLTATGLPARTAAAFDLGFENVDLGGVRLPLDLTALGLPGCHLGVVPVASATVVADALGSATLTLPVSLPATGSLLISSQVVHALVQNPTSLADWGSTNAVHSTLGATGLCNALYALGSTATVAQQGPQPVNNSIVLLVR